MTRQTNVEFVTELMELSSYGVLSQVFVIEAIRYYSEQVSKTPEPPDNITEFINPKLWHKIATDINSRMKIRYES